jgi:hypothetical protein
MIAVLAMSGLVQATAHLEPINLRHHEIVERSVARVYETGGMRRVHLRGLGNIYKRGLIHAGAFTLGIIMRQLLRAGTPRGFVPPPARPMRPHFRPARGNAGNRGLHRSIQHSRRYRDLSSDELRRLYAAGESTHRSTEC